MGTAVSTCAGATKCRWPTRTRWKSAPSAPCTGSSRRISTPRRLRATGNRSISRSSDVEPRLLLVHFLREQLRLTGTHVGCDTTQCGACTVLVDGRSAKSCTLFAVQADGSEITTIEGLASDGRLHPLQECFWEEHGLQ